MRAIWRLFRRLLPALAACAIVPPGAAAQSPDPAGAPLLALTPAEYNNTIADLLGFPRDGKLWPERPALAAALSPVREPSKGVFAPPPPPPVWPWRFPSEAGTDGFEGIVQGQAPSPYQVEELHLAAMHFASFALVSPTFFTCDDWESLPRDAQRECAWSSLERLARRAYRRPLDDPERERLETFWRENEAAGPLDEAVALTVAGILQAPPVHFRTGRPTVGGAASAGSTASIDPWSLSSRLSYFLWDSMPDDELFAAAEAGRLGTRAEVEGQARRMLDDPKARPAIVRFHHQWLGTDDVLLIAPARRAFGPLFGIAPRIRTASDDDLEWPAIMGPVRHSMKYETELFVEQAIFDGAGTFTALMTDNHGYLSDATAPIYGEGATRIPGGAPVTKPIELVVASIGREKNLTLYPASFPEAERAGVLTLPSVLALGAYAVQPGPILRGVRVLERLACMPLGEPVEGAEAALPPDTLTAERTNRERTEAATSSRICATCHERINPPGFAFEHYDAIGRWRAEDNGQPVDASGVFRLAGGEEIAFTDGVDLARQLARSERVRDCYVLHWTRYALGDHLAGDAAGVGELQARFRMDDSIKNLLVAIAGSELFRTAAAGGGEGDHP
ncbi:MAG: DUF1592 domain-containing protein [Acidobacteria bacterium]|nr:DUF1592 domain-containing protein [Acidobacteriota bacterium]